ncbi:glucose-6-phosphate dehydrogenase assembly protein OpcA [Kitasatospora cineracea]|uniref:Glucose-6-phosphate dehydrogenase assembly protein OpcA n=1 Tax=Kitasatospora cineracea TaxID=88074 RepID=A0A3N4RZF6_9ACTN|nr:glucose-6-phosphate dehydrogenase assembly protein OpcA [Kitasatospora cineracea]ROR38416.1 glucose-6-phosphate dehydrogenase assembly protein OpcA [Kitasatospora cineracea]RPE32140.1 glucose-6-phosphate dehydrogenase assembly protein OpcA [Kitasatospora cineracea]
MKIDLTDTTSSKINATMMDARRASGSTAAGMVLTLVIVTDEGSAYDALKAANDASREHPSRILAVIKRAGRSPRARAETRLDAEILVGTEAGSGETVVLRMHGELAAHAQSVVLPLLLPDAPVVVWWPDNAPLNPAQDPLGALAQRRITDAVTAESPVGQLAQRAAGYTPGDTDLAWTRITGWRSMLAAALDQRDVEITGAVVEGESYNPSVELLGLWLHNRLRVQVERVVTGGPGITAVRLRTKEGDITLDRPDGLLGTLCMPGAPDRMVALKRRDTAELIAEELRRLDPDDIYAAAVRTPVDRLRERIAGVEHAGPGGTVEASAPAAAEPEAKVVESAVAAPARVTAKLPKKAAPAAKKATAKKAAPRKRSGQ